MRIGQTIDSRLTPNIYCGPPKDTGHGKAKAKIGFDEMPEGHSPIIFATIELVANFTTDFQKDMIFDEKTSIGIVGVDGMEKGIGDAILDRASEGLSTKIAEKVEDTKFAATQIGYETHDGEILIRIMLNKYLFNPKNHTILVAAVAYELIRASILHKSIREGKGLTGLKATEASAQKGTREVMTWIGKNFTHAFTFWDRVQANKIINEGIS